MGGRVKKALTAESRAGSEINIRLFGPGMTALHKAGLAGLWMTLQALEEENGKAALDNGSWERTPTTVTLRWQGEPETFFKELFERSFRIDSNGLVWFPALGEPMQNPQHAVVLQEAILGSFLQHGKTRKADPSADPQGNFAFETGETVHISRFHRVSEYAHQKRKYSLTSPNALAGWLFPGGVVRHTALQNATALEESPERALMLRFAPVGIIYFEIRQKGGGARPRYALVIPEINDLRSYAAARTVFVKYGVQQLYAAGTADAAFRVLSALKAANLLGDVDSAFCRVISFGTVPWSTQQKTRVRLMTVRADSEEALQTFAFCRQVFPPRLVKPKKGDPFWDIPQVPDLVAHNLCEGRKWWEGFADFVADQARRKHIFSFEKGGLVKMAEDPKVFPEGPERVFVQACHEAWRRRMAKIGEKAKREGSSFRDQVSREFERLRVEFSRCKNAPSLREAVTDFWARGGGPLRSLQDNWNDLLHLLDEKNWRKAKDLVLLALASYKPATPEEAKALEESEANQQEGGTSDE